MAKRSPVSDVVEDVFQSILATPKRQRRLRNYLVTNGDEIRVYLFRGAVQPDVMLMTFKGGELRVQWMALY